MGFQFSDVLIPFKASVEAAVKGINQLKNAMNELGNAAKKIDNAVNGLDTDKFGNKFKAIDNNVLRTLDRMGLLLVMSRGLRTALESIAGPQVTAAFNGLAEGMLIAGTLARLAKDNFGLAAAGVAGLATAILLTMDTLARAQKMAQDESTEATIKAQKVMAEYDNAVADATKTGELFGETFGEKMAKRLQLARSSYESTLQKLRDISAEKDKLDAKLKDLEAKEPNAGQRPKVILGTDAFGLALGTEPAKPGDPLTIAPSPALRAAREEVEAYRTAMEGLKKTLADIERDAALLRLADQVGKFSTALRDNKLALEQFGTLAPRLEQLAEALQSRAGFGQNLPEQQRIENARQEMKLREQIFENTTQDVEATRRIVELMQQKLELNLLDKEGKEKLVELQNKLKTGEEDIAVAMRGVIDAQDRLNEALAGQKFTQAFTIPLTQAIGNAVVNGILEGKRGMEILADLSQNLLGAALNDVMKRFQQGMIDVFKAVAGAGGELLGAALITVVGVVAGVLGRRASSTSTFDKIKNQIESTQAVRGIVAGPTNVAIAAVGDNLRRALVGVEQRLDVLIQVSLQIRDRVGGVPFAGSVAA